MNGLVFLITTMAVSAESGWYPLSGGGVEYIIQVEPEALDQLRRQQEMEIDVPANLDVRRVRITVGTGKLPRQNPADATGANSDGGQVPALLPAEPPGSNGAVNPPANANNTGGPNVPVPARGAYLGITAPANNPEGLYQLERMINKPLAIQQYPFDDGYNFSDRLKIAPNGLFELVNSNHNAIPMLTVQSRERTLAEIISNTIHPADNRLNRNQPPDEYYRILARSFKKYGKPIFFRWNQEMNVPWAPYSTTPGYAISLDRDTKQQQRPEDFVRAWRHIHDVFVQEGATNASWVWCPASRHDAEMANLYPGDAYVDWVALDDYNWSPPGPWKTFNELFAQSYKHLLQIAPTKPVMIAEFNCNTGNDPTGARKAAWMTDAFARVPTEYPRIKALLLFNTSVKPKGNLATDWQIQNFPAVVNAVKAAVANDYYLSTIP